MDFDDRRVDVGGVQDRRGGGLRGGGLRGGGLRGGGLRRGGRGVPVAVGGGGLGVVGLLLVLAVNLLGGGGGAGGGGFDLSQVQPGVLGSGPLAGGESTAELEERCNGEGALERYADCFVIKVSNEVDEVWTEELPAATGVDYRPPSLVFFSGGTSTGCGGASSEVGPFYCPPDEAIFLDLDFLDQLQAQFGAEGRYATAYIVAHEAGHHLQTLLGTERQVRAAQQAGPDRRNALSVALELQADCYAGVWGRQADDRGNLSVTGAEVDQALRAAAAVGDDRIQQRTQGRVDPESWTHGSAEQRRSWYERGFTTGDPAACDTFAR
ncbi:KPN_02809 family neutral zinc metallopeptidase [Vallicoccus soli]|uniref:Metalloprotease n=1 Tax=Vallicoccus soli TaxID=2339232 RepID=A0A3A3ZF76_9ACTN|nr:neutral zinc metallopeptidase [Vallicoccus soli]RJK93777.1 metalloprotease [Vallicoccus soli]